MHKTLSFLLLLTVACAGAQRATRPAGMPQPDVEAHLVNPLFFGSTTSAPATVEINVTNRGTVPLVVRRIELDSPGMGQYYLLRYIRIYNETVPPGATKAITAFATAIAQTTTRPTEPLTMRAVIELQASGKTWREIAIFRENL